MDRKNEQTNDSNIEELRERYAKQQEMMENIQKDMQKTLRDIAKAEASSVVPSQRVLDESKKMGPMDDVFFNKLAEDVKAIEEVISVVLGFPIIVKEVVPQYTIAGMGARGVRLDSFATIVPQVAVKAELCEDCFLGEKGAFVNIEVQKDNNDDFEYRVYYNGASLVVNNTPKGTKKFADIARAVVIFISKFDVFGEGEMYYEVQKSIKKSGTPRRSPVTEIYINTVNEDTSDDKMSNIADLMKLFKDPEAYNYEKFPNFSQRKHDLKTDEGVLEMSEGIQMIIDEEKEAAMEVGMEEGMKLMSYLFSHGRSEDANKAMKDKGFLKLMLEELKDELAFAN